jgi:DNA-binding transcriptional MerR regulator
MPLERSLPIGRLSALTGVKVTTIRYYEREGLLRSPPRTASARRCYGEADVRRLTFIRRARELGFETHDVRALLDLSDHAERPCDEADLIAKRRLEAVNHKIGLLARLRDELGRMIDQGRHGRVAECRVIEALSDPVRRQPD